MSRNNLSKAVILAAGRGKRMLYLTEEVPKPLLNVGGRTFLDHIFDAGIFRYEPVGHETGEYYLTSMMNQFVKDHKVRAVIGSSRLSFTSPEDITRYF